MTDLAASVGVRLSSVDIASDALREKVKRAEAPYVRAQIGPFIIGRSNIIDPESMFLTLPRDDARWTARVRVPEGGAVSVVVEVWDAGSSAGPLERLAGTIGAPWPEGLIAFKSDHVRVTANLFDVRVVPAKTPASEVSMP
mgnify:FL=1